MQSRPAANTISTSAHPQRTVPCAQHPAPGTQRKNLITLLVATTLFLPTLTHAEDAPAVSAVNAKLEALGGSVDSGDSDGLAASVAIPLSHRYGLQLDAMGGKVADKSARGAGFYAFWRDPNRSLLGITGLYAERADIGMSRIGIEGERYFDDFTVAASAGQQTGDVDDASYANLDLRWYGNDNLMLEAGAFHADSTSALRLGAEFQPGQSGLTLFVDTAAGDDGFDYLLGGVRWYFGASKSLKRRHREDDPVNAVMTGLNNSVQTMADVERRIEASRVPADGTACTDSNGRTSIIVDGVCVIHPDAFVGIIRGGLGLAP